MKKYIFKKDTELHTFVPQGSKMNSYKVTFKKGSVEDGEEGIDPMVACPQVVGQDKCNRYLEIKVPGGQVVRIINYLGPDSPVEEYKVQPVPRQTQPVLKPSNKIVALRVGISATAGGVVGGLISVLAKKKPAAYVIGGAIIGAGLAFGHSMYQKNKQ